MPLFYVYIYLYRGAEFKLYAISRVEADKEMKEHAKEEAAETGSEPLPFSFVRRERW